MATTVDPQITGRYNKLKSEYAEIFKRFLEFDEQRRQHSLVLTNVSALLGERRTWRVMGGVLVEQTMAETQDSLKQNVSMLEQTIKALDEEMTKREKEVMEMELKYNLKDTAK